MTDSTAPSPAPETDIFAAVVPVLASALKSRGFETLTPVQEAVLAPHLAEKDLLVSAQTGSGKTVAFGLALASTLLEGADKFPRLDAPLALAVAPTRELALQVQRELQWLYAGTGANVASCVGGMDIRDERRALSRGAHIVVGTPGRLNDHIKRGSLDMSGMKAIILDEADEMLDLGFREELEYILAAAPKQRRTLMFSATVSRPIATLAKNYQNNAERVNTTTSHKQHIDIEYRALSCSPQTKENAIINVLRYYDAKNALVFCATRATVNHLTSRLNNRGFSVVALSGELSQKERSHALQAMRDGRAKVCVATDVAARGIDLPELDLVIHADLPKNQESLLHRSGRTGRAGRKGVSALIVPFKAKPRVTRLLKDAKVTAEWAKPPSAAEVLLRDNERLLADPSLSEAVQDNEKEFAAQLLNIYAPEQIAAAFVRLYRKNHSAPEEIDDEPAHFANNHQSSGPKERRGKSGQNDFDSGVWIALNVGRNRSAEPRWLLPLLCKAGKLTKKDIGAIRIQQDETHVEIRPEAYQDFIDNIGPDAKLDKSIRVSPIDGKPASASPSKKQRKSGHGPKPGESNPYQRKGPKPEGKKYDKSVARKRLEEKEAAKQDWSPSELRGEDDVPLAGDTPLKRKKPKKKKPGDKNKGKPKGPVGKGGNSTGGSSGAQTKIPAGVPGTLKRKKRSS